MSSAQRQLIGGAKRNFQYRDSRYFNTKDVYTFQNGMREFKSKVEFYNGSWYTIESLQYKATSVECYKN